MQQLEAGHCIQQSISMRYGAVVIEIYVGGQHEIFLVQKTILVGIDRGLPVNQSSKIPKDS